MSADALLRSVLANPDDDLPRLVYADWLDDHGDPARAEFIRVQCELAKLPDHDPRVRALEDREHALLSEHERGWLGEGRDVLREWEWKRGFIHSLAATSGRVWWADELRRAGHAVRRIHCVGHQARGGATFADWYEEEWPGHVEHLDFQGCQFDPEHLRHFLEHAPLSDLRGLDLSDTRTGYDPSGYFWHSPVRHRLSRLTCGPVDPHSFHPVWMLEAFAQAPITHLRVPDCGVTNDDLACLMPTNWAGTLRELDISENPIAPDGHRAFEQADPDLRLDRLDVSGTPLAGISLEPLLHSRPLRSLTRLEMNGCGSARRNMEVLAGSPYWTQATELRANSGTIPASTLESLSRSAGPPALRTLDLSNNFVRTEGVRMLCEAAWAGSLTWLGLSRNYLDDEACEALAKSGRFTNLRTLHLSGNNGRQPGGDGEAITDDGVYELFRTNALGNLRVLTLSHASLSPNCVWSLLRTPSFQLSGLGLAGCDLPRGIAWQIGSAPLGRLNWLDLSGNPQFGGQALRRLAESPDLSPLLELDCGGIAIDDDVRAIFRDRLGPRFSH